MTQEQPRKRPRRHLGRVKLDMEDFFDTLIRMRDGRKYGSIIIPTLSGVPKDTKFIESRYEYGSRSLDLTLEHESFPEQHECAEIEYIMGDWSIRYEMLEKDIYRFQDPFPPCDLLVEILNRRCLPIDLHGATIDLLKKRGYTFDRDSQIWSRSFKNPYESTGE